MSSFLAPGARSNAAGALPAGILASANVMPFTVTFPVFSTVTVYVMTSSLPTPLSGSALFVTLIAGAASTVVTVAEAVPVTSSFLGFLPFAVTVFRICPASTSACVTV